MNNHPFCNPNAYNYNRAFQSYNSPLIQNQSYKNPNNTLHDNLNQDSLKDEVITEYRINIDSKDRDITRYVDPFHFKVSFDPIGPSTIRSTSGNLLNNDEVILGTPLPHINKKFKNIKYVKLDHVIYPLYYGIKDDGGWQYDTDKNTSLERFINLRIKELEDENAYSTNIDSEKAFSLIGYNKTVGEHVYGTPFYGTKIFPNNKLGNISNLSIDFYDNTGTELKYTDLDSGQATTDVRHPLYKGHQVHVSLLIGVVENHMNTDVGF